ncbi:LysR family transcriptional regulator [Pontivivens ytuae]|uniref:LysR family transcriptional regulator n=1 Tax=Pontivivens ytuae TaxID=2789856 RepID=A0A7S9QDV8_9RHOB|nr:LysR family transcriptional regulator [Pontivivens ytuae]QPH54772.1 LysR family transcriptional regulator [Pontivivens ytuae]
MQNTLAWDDIALFSAVARAGSLTRAAEEAGCSVATLSRRMKAFERRSGRRLFLHGAQGYTVTADGRALLDRARRMEAVAAEIATWQAEGTGPVRVRISAGTWTGLQLAEDLSRVWRPSAGWVPEFVHCNRDLDIARREIDIGIRNRRPEQPWLAGRRTGVIEHAVYATSEEVTGWIGGSFETAPLPSEAWISRHHGAEIVTTANDPQLRMIMAEAGLGRVILPMFVGETRPALIRLSDAIEELTRDEWLVCHHEARFEPPIRAALDVLADILSRRDWTGVAPAA